MANETGEKIRALREALKMSQTEFGEKVGGVSFVTVHRWETGKSKPHKSFMNKMKKMRVPA